MVCGSERLPGTSSSIGSASCCCYPWNQSLRHINHVGFDGSKTIPSPCSDSFDEHGSRGTHHGETQLFPAARNHLQRHQRCERHYSGHVSLQRLFRAIDWRRGGMERSVEKYRKSGLPTPQTGLLAKTLLPCNSHHAPFFA